MNLKCYGHFKWHFWFKISFTTGGFLLIYSRNEIFSNFCSIKAIHKLWINTQYHVMIQSLLLYSCP